MDFGGSRDANGRGPLVDKHGIREHSSCVPYTLERGAGERHRGDQLENTCRLPDVARYDLNVCATAREFVVVKAGGHATTARSER